MKRTLLYLLILCFSALLNAQSFNLIKEINTVATSNAITNVIGLAATGNTIFYVATDGVNGSELWKSDGTPAGTFMVKDINPGSASGITVNSTPNSGNTFNANNGILYFLANDGSTGNELWRSDGTNAGTYLVKDITPGSASTTLQRLFFHNGLLFFGATDGVSGLELWKSDGTEAGTVMVKDINPGSAAGLLAMTNPYFFTALGSDIYFPANNGVAGIELWKSDGTTVGTVMVKDIIPGSGSSINIQKATVFNNKLFFAATNGAAVNGTELWVTNGTDAGTSMVKDIVPGSGNSFPNNFIEFNGSLFFSASSTNNANPDIWKTDGTDAGTVMVKNLVADGIAITIGNSSPINDFTIANSKLFFRINNSPLGSELYATDGTAAGSGIVSDYYPGANGVNPSGLVAYNNNIYFIGTDLVLPGKGSTMYKSDGTAAGTVPLATGVTANILGLSAVLNVIANNRLYFFGNTIDHGAELWSTDGSSSGTTLVKDANTQKTGTPNSGVNMLGSVVMGGKYYFAAADDDNGMELWKSDGTAAGTVIVKDIWLGKGSSYPSQFTAYNGMIYFMASDELNGSELWKTDGTEAGTVMIADIAPGAVSSSISRITVNNNILFFSAYHPLYGQEFWRSDGTATGTSMLVDLVSGSASGITGPNDALSIGNNIYLLANIANGNILGIPPSNRLFKLDAITQTLSEFFPTITASQDIASIGTTLYITGRNAAGNTILWKSENGGAVTQVKVLSTSSVSAFSLTDCNGKLYFNGSNGATSGSEPWISDGTEAGTYMIKDLSPGGGQSSPEQFVYSGGKVYFTAITPIGGGHELWATDGTNAGTYLVKDIQQGAGGSRPSGTISIPGNKVLFVANDGVNGNELWQSDGTAAGTTQFPEFNNSGDGAIPANSFFINFPNDFFYSKLNDNIVFFARSADKGMQLYSGSVAGRYKYVNDNSSANDIFTTAVGNNANNGSQSAPYATVSYAVSQAQVGDTIYVDAGVFVEQVTLDKGITLIGAGSGVTIIWKPAVTNPPPGPFFEQGTIQTAQNIGDVHIRDMSVTGDNNGVTPIILQTGGSVKNCRLIGGNQGIFFRVNPAIKTALIENNYINVEYIGINCAGTGLSASLINNTIELNNPFFAAGVFAGQDFGPLVRFTAFGNIIRNYNAQGMLANSYNTNITQNSFTGTGAHAIEQSTNSLGFATCNWYGTTNAGVVASKVSGFFSYTPYLTDGTNTITTYGNYGFLPVAGSCAEGVSNFYVNDNSLTNDVFTTAAGSNSNAGTRSAPFATLSYAISVAPANSVIHVDAGTYSEQVIIDRGIVINGAGKDLTNFVKPATTLVPAPGPFAEIGLIETTQGIGDVHIRNISVNSVDGSSQNIIIQSGGSVKNCKLLNGGQGVFFRIASGSRNAEVSFNTIQPTGIGINCQGAGLTANIVNNTISNPAGYYAGIFGGLDFGVLPQISITNNKISDYFGTGILANSNSSNINNNSIVGTPLSIAIQGNSSNATCNWYGSNTPAIIGPITYSPFLTSGTDNSTDLGFQSVPGSCNGVQHNFYVNDNSNIGNVFTFAAGNDNNSGSPAAPLLTITAALTKAQAGDTIFVDAGTYVLSADLTIGKAVTILGTNYLLSPNDANDKRVLNAVRNAESIVSNATLIIGSNDISIQGMVLDPGTAAIAVFLGNSTNYNNISLAKNRLKMNSTSPAIRLEGQGTNTIAVSALVNSGFTINDNRFEKYDANHSNAINISRLKNITVTNNAFVIGGATLRNYTAIGMGSVGVIDAVTFSSNTIDRALNAINGTRIGNAVLNWNKIYNTTNAINATNGAPESSNIEFSNNLLDGNAGVFPFVFYTRNGGSIAGSSSQFKTENNAITGTAVPGTTTLLGSYNITFSNTVLSPSLIIRSNTFNYAGDLSTVEGQFLRPISIKGNLANATVDHNEITLSGINLQPKNPLNVLPVCPAISLYTDNGSTSGIPAGAVINILNNKIHGFKHSFVVFDPVNGSDPYTGFGNLGPNISVNVHENRFTGDSMCINNGSIGYPIDASCNWYGSTALQNLVGKFSTDLDNIYVPYLTNGTDNDASTGFQAVPGSCNGQPIQARLDGFTNVTCNGANNGTASVTVFNGVAPFVFAWTKDGNPLFSSNAEDPTNFGPGTYHLTITDVLGTNIILNANTDITTIDVTITEPPLLTANAGGTNVSCFNGSNGTATVTVGGGTLPYTYAWSNGGTIQSISGLTMGTYNITVTDAKGCTAQSSYQVTQPTLLTAVATGTSTTCANSATVVASGGTAPYTYLWNNGATTQAISSLPAGTYTAIVTDNKGCTATASCTVTANEAFNPSASVSNVSCFNTSTGSITVNNPTTPGPFRFSIDGVNFSAPQAMPYTFNNLPADTFTVTVRDVNGCTGFVTKIVTQPPLLVVTQGVVQSTCSGQSTGSIAVTATGGSGSLSYSWTGPGGYTSTQKNISALATGNYALTVTDANGCSKNLNVTVPVYPPINVSANITNVTCFGNANGSIDLTVAGGTGNGFTYSWNNGVATTQDRINLAPGTNYKVTITDIGSGCQLQNITYTITQPAALGLNLISNSDVNGCISMGVIEVAGTGGTSPYQYKLNYNGSYQSSGLFQGLPGTAAGIIDTMWVKDSRGCIYFKSYTIKDDGNDAYEGSGGNKNNTKGKPFAISLGTIAARIATTGDPADWYLFNTNIAGNYTLILSHPSASFIINIYTGDSTAARVPLAGSTTLNKTYYLLGGKQYLIQVTGGPSPTCYQLSINNSLLTKMNTGLITQENKTPVDQLNASVFPNPHRGAFGIKIESPVEGTAIVEIMNSTGQLMAEKRVPVNKGGMSIANFTNMQHSILFYRVIIGNEVRTGKIIGPN